MVVRVLKPVEATVLDVVVASVPGATPVSAEATVRVRTGPQRSAGVRRAADGLSHGVEELERRGLQVAVPSWEYDADGATCDEIPGWDKRVQTFHPQMSLRSFGAGSVTLRALADGLEGSGFKVSRRSPAGFRARYHNWIRFGIELATFVGASAERTTLDITSSADGRDSVVTIRVAAGFEHWGSRDRAARGLTTALRELRRQGLDVVATPWTAG